MLVSHLEKRMVRVGKLNEVPIGNSKWLCFENENYMKFWKHKGLFSIVEVLYLLEREEIETPIEFRTPMFFSFAIFILNSRTIQFFVWGILCYIRAISFILSVAETPRRGKEFDWLLFSLHHHAPCSIYFFFRIISYF